ncbi:MAG: 3-deoxy-manno-octulosonate cytidylyltransferase [Chlamydiia bacterium]|nr:3-deoxy-manno-octulosonate cytidylyltransferase [Chlamydiia bacterium]
MPQPQIVGIIPARMESSRFPGKMLTDILGKSLIQRTYENACRSKFLDHVVVATDDPRIYAHLAQLGGEVVLTSADCQTGTDRVAEAARTYFPYSQIIVNIQGDEPCLDPQVIDRLIERMAQNKEYEMVTAAALIHDEERIDSPHVVKTLFDQNGRALYFSRNRLPFPYKREGKYYRHIGIYAYRSSLLGFLSRLSATPLQLTEDLEQLKVLESGYPIYVEVVDDQAIGVDTLQDLEVIKKFICKKKENIYSSQEA